MTKKKPSKETQSKGEATPQAGGQTTDTIQHEPDVIIHAQYAKDFSFENPNAPAVFREEGRPEIEIGVNVTLNPQAEKERLFEVVLHIRAAANRNDKALYLADVSYAAILSVHDKFKDEDEMNRVAVVQGAGMIFPFIRAEMTRLTMGGGFAPLNLQPIDFDVVYQTGLDQAANQAAADSA